MDLITREGLGDLISDGYDLGIRFGEPRPSTLVARRLLDTRVLTVASPGYLKKHGHPTAPQQLVAERHLMIDFRDPETGRPFEWAFRKGRKEIKVETQSQLMLSDVATMHAVCLAGCGIAQVLELGVDAHLSGGRLVVLFPDWEEERFPLLPIIRRANTWHRRRAHFLNSYLRRSMPRARANNSRLNSKPERNSRHWVIASPIPI